MGQSSKSTLKAINDIYIIEEDPIETSYESGVSSEVTEALKSGRLFIPDAYSNFTEKYPCRGTVVAAGDKVKYHIPLGAKVVYARMGVQRYQLNGKNLCTIRECDIHYVIESC